MTTGAVWIITKISVSSRHRKVKKYKGFRPFSYSIKILKLGHRG